MNSLVVPRAGWQGSGPKCSRAVGFSSDKVCTVGEMCFTGVYVRCRAFLLVASQMQQRAAFVAFRDQRADLERIFMRYKCHRRRAGGVQESCLHS